MKTKTIEVNLENELIESLLVATLEDQARSMARQIKGTVEGLTSGWNNWRDLFDEIKTFNALQEALDYNSWEHASTPFFPFDDLMKQPKEWIEKPNKTKGKKK